MGMNIHGSYVKAYAMVAEIHDFVVENGGYREGSISADEFFSKVSLEFGIMLDGYFVTVYNEYYSDSGYNPQAQFNQAVMRYYFPERGEEIEDGDLEFYPDTKSFGDGANAEEILDSLFPEEFGYEGKFSQ